MRRKVLILTILIVFILTFSTGVLFGAGSKAEKEKQIVFGYVVPGPDPWYGYARDGFLFAAKKRGVKVIVVNSDYDQEKEQANIDDLITQGVDGIDLFSFNPDGVQIAAQKCNKAGIPILAEMSHVAPGPGKVITDVEFDWRNMGVMKAKYYAEKHPGEKVLVITGIIGQGPIDLLLDGLKATVKELGKNEIVSIQPADYNREKAMNIMQNMLQSGKEFTLVDVHNEDMALGVVQVLKDAGVLNNPIHLITNNGMPEGLEAVKRGDFEATISTSPGVEGLVCFEALYRYVVMGKELPPKIMIPMTWITKENVDEAVSWVVDDRAYESVVKMFDELVGK